MRDLWGEGLIILAKKAQLEIHHSAINPNHRVQDEVCTESCERLVGPLLWAVLLFLEVGPEIDLARQ